MSKFNFVNDCIVEGTLFIGDQSIICLKYEEFEK